MKHLLIIFSILLLSSLLFGQCTRTKQLGTSSKDYGTSVTTDSSGNIYVTGYTEGGLDGNTNSGESDIFLVKYNSSGAKQWTKQLGTTSIDTGHGPYTTGFEITSFFAWVIVVIFFLTEWNYQLNLLIFLHKFRLTFE